MPDIRKKLIEVSIPLEAINKASAREKSIRHGHPSTLHLWWARRPLAACRAVLFAQLVDDPSAWPDRFPTEEAQDKERARLHRVIERLVPWEASNNETILNEARWEIARSVAWGLGEEPPPQQDTKAILDYLQTKAPPVYDPFSGGGSIPLEAQRLGLRAYGSDLNPVAVLIGKALVEIPPKFAGRAPVNPRAQSELMRSGGTWTGKGAQGLAEDVRYYGQWMRDEAEKRIGHLYPKAQLPDGTEAPVIAWLWARTVRSPNPAAKGAMVPLVSSFMLSTKAGKKAWVEVVIDDDAPDGWRFLVHDGILSPDQEEILSQGIVNRGGARCILTGSPIAFDHIRKEARAGLMSTRLMAVVAEGNRRRVYLTPTASHEEAGSIIRPEGPKGEISHWPGRTNVVVYGMTTFDSLFTARQLTALTTLYGLISEARSLAEGDAVKTGQSLGHSLADNGESARAYADALSIYLAFAVDKGANYWSSVCAWNTGGEKLVSTFGRQSIPMVWDFTEANPFCSSSGNFMLGVEQTSKNLDSMPSNVGAAEIYNIDAAKNNFPNAPFVISTDPPYYDNIGYGDISDFFYVWLKSYIGKVFPDLFRRLNVPKDEELVAKPHIAGSREGAEIAFMQGMSQALQAIRGASVDQVPQAIYYAFKQSEVAQDGITSAGWSSFLQSIIDANLCVDGTWPMRMEYTTTLKSKMNVLASAVVLVCRKRPVDAGTITRSDFIRLLKRELPDAIEDIRQAGVGPVDMQQSVIGPGMGVFSRHAKVLEDDDSAMTVKTALAIINRIWGEIENEADASLDPETQVALAWFATYGFDARSSGDLIMLANAKNVACDALYRSGVFQDLRGKAQLTPRTELPKDWSPSTDKTLTVWECVQHAARVFRAEDGGEVATARLIGEMGNRSQEALLLAGRLFQIATDKGWSQEALVYNELAAEWPRLEALAGDLAASGPVKPVQTALDL